jgi:hypothetical protein
MRRDGNIAVSALLMLQDEIRFIFLLEHDLFGKPVPTFPDHALRPQGTI